MEHETNNHQREKLKQDDTEFTKTNTYDFDKIHLLWSLFSRNRQRTLGDCFGAFNAIRTIKTEKSSQNGLTVS